MLWKLIFDNPTKRGAGCNREPLAGEFSVDLPPKDCAWFMNDPGRYQYVNGVNSEVAQDIIDVEVFAHKKKSLQDENKASCKAHILSKYPLENQLSSALGVYPDSVAEDMTDFIASCIHEENRVFDNIEAATTAEELTLVARPVWPEV